MNPDLEVWEGIREKGGSEVFLPSPYGKAVQMSADFTLCAVKKALPNKSVLGIVVVVTERDVPMSVVNLALLYITHIIATHGKDGERHYG